MTPEQAARTAAREVDIPMHKMSTIFDQVMIWRRRGVEVTLDGDNLRLRVPADLPPDAREDIRSYLRERKPAIVALLANLDGRDRNDWLVSELLGNGAFREAMLDAYVALAAENFVTSPLGGLKWDAARQVWANAWPLGGTPDPVDRLCWDDAWDAAERVLTRAIEQSWEFATDLDEIIWHHQPKPLTVSEIDAWLHAALRPVIERLTAWLVENHGTVLAQLRGAAERRAARYADRSEG